MSEILAKLISLFSFSRQFFDKETITLIIEKLVKEYKLEDYIKHIVVIDFNEKEENNINGSYSYLNKKIIINIPMLYQQVSSIINANQHLVTEEEKYFEFNIRIIEALLHEIKHAQQFKKYVEDEEENFEKTILSYFFKNIVELENTNDFEKPIYKDIADLNRIETFYLYSPSERMADLSSSNQVINMFSDPDFKDFKMAKIYYYILHTFRELRGYDMVSNKLLSPTAKYKYEYERIMKQYGRRITSPNQQLEELYLKNQSKKLSMQDRIYYGLPITQEEQNQILERRKKLMDLYQ